MNANHAGRRSNWRTLLCCAALGAALLAGGCGGDDDDAPMTPVLSDVESFEVASGAAISTIASMTTLVGDLPGVDIGDGGRRKQSGARSAMRLAWEAARARLDAARKADDDAPRIPFLDCGSGGTADEQCTVAEGLATAAVTFDNCKESGEEGTITLDGVVSIAVDRPAFCVTGEIEEGDAVSLAFQNFAATLTDPTQAVVESFAANFSMSFVDEGPGCAGNDAAFMMNGTMRSMTATGATDLEIVANNLLVAVSSAGDPCVVTLQIDGSMTVDDAAGERALSQSFDDFAMTCTGLPNDRVSFTLDGALDVDCAGTVTFDTVEPVIFVGAAECPAAGLVDVTLENGVTARIGFTTEGGVDIDHGADGSVEESFPSCHAEEIADCPS